MKHFTVTKSVPSRGAHLFGPGRLVVGVDHVFVVVQLFLLGLPGLLLLLLQRHQVGPLLLQLPLEPLRLTLLLDLLTLVLLRGGGGGRDGREDSSRSQCLASQRQIGNNRQGRRNVTGRAHMVDPKRFWL